MNRAKRNYIVQQLTGQPEPHLVWIERFLDGNDDLGSIGCNLAAHPGMQLFREVFGRLLKRSDVSGVYAQMSELEPDEDSWPFSDLVFVEGTLSIAALAAEVQALQPDSVTEGQEFGVSRIERQEPGYNVLAIWWD